MRSKLFVPAARPEFLAKALAGMADAISFDLEDAVPPDAKVAARSRLREFLQSEAVRGSAKTIIVRINAFGSPHFEADLAILRDARVDLINLPKIGDAEEMRAAAAAIERFAPDARLLVNIESPHSLARAAAVANAHPAIAGLQAGLNDLFNPMRIDRADFGNVRSALWQIRMAAGEAGIFAYDGAWPDLRNMEGFRKEACLAASLGFLGKSCIHPDQVAVANKIFDRSDELTRARRIVDAAREAAASGKGAFLLDGKMVDQPEIAHAKALLAAAAES